MFGEQSGGIGTESEEGAVPERDNPGIAEDQVERDREQAENGNLVEKQKALGQEKQRSQRDQPKQNFADAPAAPARQLRCDGAGAAGRLIHRPLLRRAGEQPLWTK